MGKMLALDRSTDPQDQTVRAFDKNVDIAAPAGGGALQPLPPALSGLKAVNP